MQRERFELGDLIAELQVLVRSHAPVVLLAVALIAAVYTALDLAEAQNSSGALSIVVSVYGQRQVVAKLLADRMPSDSLHYGYGAILASSLLGGLAVLAGLVLLVVPGLFLLAAWSATTPFILVEEMGAIAALGASWRATAGSRGPIMLAYALYSLVLIGGAGLALVALDQVGASGSALEIVITNIAAGLFIVSGWLLAAAVYRRVMPMSGGFQAVFA